MNFEQTINGITKYLNNEIYIKMNDWQEIIARIAVSRLMGNTEQLKTALISNPFVQTFGIITSDGNVDVDGIMRDLRCQIERKGSITLSIPMFGNFTFKVEDVDKLHRTIKGGIINENNTQNA